MKFFSHIFQRIRRTLQQKLVTNNRSASLDPIERIILSISLAGFVLFCLILWLNPIHYAYRHLLADIHLFVWVAYLNVMLLCSICMRKSIAPIAGEFLVTLFLTLIALSIGLALEGPLLLTPFAPIDHMLAIWDAHLGIHTTHIMAWIHQPNHNWHHMLVPLLQTAYASLTPIMILTPLFLHYTQHNTQRSRLYLLATMLGGLIASFIYFFWPTTAPITVLPSPYYNIDANQLLHRFILIHHNLPFTHTSGAGLIAFPSCHVLWTCILIFTYWHRPILRWMMLMLGCLIIWATMALGYHYGVDVIAGMLIAVLSHGIARQIIKAKMSHAL